MAEIWLMDVECQAIYTSREIEEPSQRTQVGKWQCHVHCKDSVAPSYRNSHIWSNCDKLHLWVKTTVNVLYYEHFAFHDSSELYSFLHHAYYWQSLSVDQGERQCFAMASMEILLKLFHLDYLHLRTSSGLRNILGSIWRNGRRRSWRSKKRIFQLKP